VIVVNLQQSGEIASNRLSINKERIGLI